MTFEDLNLLRPINIILVSAGARGSDVLFQYPVEEGVNEEESANDDESGNNFLININELRTLLVVDRSLCEKPFTLKVGNYLLVGHPILMDQNESEDPREFCTLIHVVFTLNAQLFNDKSVLWKTSLIKQYQTLSHYIAIAIRFEQTRCKYFATQREIITSILEKEAECQDNQVDKDTDSSVFDKVLQENCKLPLALKAIYNSIIKDGVVDFYFNARHRINFFIPHIIYNPFPPCIATSESDISEYEDAFQNCRFIDPEKVIQSIDNMRTYHGLILLKTYAELEQLLRGDSNPALLRVIEVCSPTICFQEMALHTDYPLSLIVSIAKHLVYWGKAVLIYPICENNVYIISQDAELHLPSTLSKTFEGQFPEFKLHKILQYFSKPLPISEHKEFTITAGKQSVDVLIWLLKNRFLCQLHTYSTLSFPPYAPPAIKQEEKNLVDDRDFERKLNVSLEYSEIDLSQHQLSWIKYLSLASYNPIDFEDINTFVRILPYLDGKHHVEDIMFYESLERAKIFALFDRFDDILLIYSIPDPNLNLS